MNVFDKIFKIALLLSFAACNGSRTTSALQNDTTVNTPTHTDSTVVSDETVYPIDTLYDVRILNTGVFHEEEVWPNIDTIRWFGLFKGKDGYYIDEATVAANRVNDPVVDEGQQKTGWEVTTTNTDTEYLLIEAQPYLQKRRVDEIRLPRYVVYPGDTLAISYHSTNYKLFATGGKKGTGDAMELWNYKLFITSNKAGRKVTQLLVAQPNFDDRMINIIFVGDIDDDGNPDIIIDVSRHYNSYMPTLYLSNPSGNDKLLVPVGMHATMGC